MNEVGINALLIILITSKIFAEDMMKVGNYFELNPTLITLPASSMMVKGGIMSKDLPHSKQTYL